MGLRDQLRGAMKEAMKAKAVKRLGTVRLMLAAIQSREIETRVEPLPEDEILGVLGRMIKQREDSATIYDSGGRPELASAERDEIVVIREFMPQQLSPEETRAAVAQIIQATGAASMKDMGKVMAALKERYAGSMDFGKANGVVKELLSVPK
ncbi:MAG: GatB/YqeY domain-containing protein [Alphaproteobacteria bacterium]|nr:GatB/YqeY domain-containing protein [Alphaproteobacteria bacterium]